MTVPGPSGVARRGGQGLRRSVVGARGWGAELRRLWSGGSRRDRALFASVIVLSVFGAAASVTFSSGRPILASRWKLLVLLGVWGATWAVAVACALRLPRRVIVPVVLVAGVVLRLGAMAGAPVLSNDLYRYSWDGRVQSAGIDPYRYPPDAPQLRSLRESWLWPDAAGCRALHHPPGCTQINRPDVRTIYPPVAEAWFTVLYNAAGGVAARYKVWQVGGLLTELATFALILRLLRQWGRDRRWIALYALCPLPVVEIVNDGHIDGLGIVLTLAALAVLGRPRLGATASSAAADGRPGGDPATGPRRRRGRLGGLLDAPGRPRAALAGILIAGATLVKLYPAAGLLAIVATPGLRWSERARAVAWFVAVVALAYLPHVLAVGVKVLGYLPGYLVEEHYSTAGRFLIPGSLPLPPHALDAIVALALLLACIWAVLRRGDPVSGTALLLGVALLCATPVQPWYAILLLALAAASAQPRWSLVTVAGYPYFFAVILAALRVSLIGRAVFGAAAALVAVLSARQSVRRRRGSEVAGDPAPPAGRADQVGQAGQAVQVATTTRS